MKKILLSCCLALGIGANAQINYTGDFEDAGSPGYSTTLYGQFGGGTRVTAAACAGTYGGQLALSSTVTTTGYMVILNEITGQTNNGQQVSVTANYKKGAGIVGTISLAYMVKDESGSWSVTPFGTATTLATGAIATCESLTATLPSGILQPTKTNAIGVWVTRTSGTGNIFVDNIGITQDNPTTAPACTTFTTPANASTVSGGNYVFTWPAVATAVNYKVTVGTTAGGSDVLNTIVSGNTLNVSLPTSKTLFAKIVPTNLKGDASGCTEITFNTTSTISYCGPLTTNQVGAIAPIKSVNFAGVTNTSDVTATTIGAFSPYEDFSSTKFSFAKGIASVPLTIKGVTNGAVANGWGMSVFIDWNNDGDFDDAGEAYFNTTASMIRVAGVTDNPVTLSGNIAIPSGVSLGNKKMRIKYNFTGTAIHDALSSGCSQLGNGQAEDYTIEVTAAPTVAPDCTTFLTPANAATSVSPYVPFTWNFVNTATSYKLYVGTTPGGTDVADGIVVAGTSYNLSVSSNTKYYAKVVASNSIGDATGCTEISFTTGVLVYCTATTTNAGTGFERISNVTFAGINNNSAATGATTGYEDFKSIEGTVEKTVNYPISVTVGSADTDQVAAWIDFNQNGLFDDSEKISLPTVSATLPVSTGNITIPADAKLGKTIMRVRINYSAAVPACGNTTYGQTEDYTIIIKDKTLAVSDVKKNSISVFPNPFTDVLKISDIKGVKSISVNDASGREVKSLAPSAELNLSNLKSGLYIVSLKMEDGSVKTFKTIKK